MHSPFLFVELCASCPMPRTPWVPTSTSLQSSKEDEDINSQAQDRTWDLRRPSLTFTCPLHFVALLYAHPVLSHSNSPQTREAFSHGHVFACAVSSAKSALSSHPWGELLLSLQDPLAQPWWSFPRCASVGLMFSCCMSFFLLENCEYTFHTLWQWLVCMTGNSP